MGPYDYEALFRYKRRGLHKQGCYGIFDSEEKAIAAAKEAKGKEPDDYHTFYINIKNLNEKTYDFIEEIEMT